MISVDAPPASHIGGTTLVALESPALKRAAAVCGLKVS
jgi:hypothetical protein